MYDTLYIGEVRFFNNEKNFGFIRTDDGKSYYFCHDVEWHKKLKAEGVTKSQRKFSVGHEVSFKLKPHAKYKDEFEAYEIRFIRNVIDIHRQEIIDQSQTDSVLQGYLKGMEGGFFIKHKDTYVFVPVKISEWEADLESVYSNRINSLVKFKLVQPSKITSLKAYLIDRKFSDLYKQVVDLYISGGEIDALITCKAEQGLFATAFGGEVIATIPFLRDQRQSQEIRFAAIKSGDIVKAKIFFVSENKHLVLSLV